MRGGVARAVDLVQRGDEAVLSNHAVHKASLEFLLNNTSLSTTSPKDHAVEVVIDELEIECSASKVFLSCRFKHKYIYLYTPTDQRYSQFFFEKCFC